jgi:rod shape-determining protein MreD
MNTLVTAIFMLISFLLQSTLLARFSIGGIRPNLILIVVATVGLMLGRRFGMISGFIGGLVVDIFFGGIIGIYALLYMYIGYLNGLFRKVLFPGDFKLPILLIVGSDILYCHGCYLLLFFLRGDFAYTFYLTNIILPEVIYTTLIAILYFPLLKFLYDRIRLRMEKAEETIG